MIARRSIPLIALLAMSLAGSLDAQARSAAFSTWTPPRIAVEQEQAAYADSTLVRVGSHAGKGALIGAAIGAGVGILVGFALGGGGCADCDNSTSPFALAAGGALIVGGAGAVIGLLAGLSSPKYEWR